MLNDQMKEITPVCDCEIKIETESLIAGKNRCTKHPNCFPWVHFWKTCCEAFCSWSQWKFYERSHEEWKSTKTMEPAKAKNQVASLVGGVFVRVTVSFIRDYIFVLLVTNSCRLWGDDLCSVGVWSDEVDEECMFLRFVFLWIEKANKLVMPFGAPNRQVNEPLWTISSWLGWMFQRTAADGETETAVLTPFWLRWKHLGPMKPNLSWNTVRPRV